MAGNETWPARYLYLEDMWRGRDRVVIDPALEFDASPDSERDPAARLLARLRARVVGSRGERVWWFHADCVDAPASRQLALQTASHSDRWARDQEIQYAQLDAAARVLREASTLWQSAFVDVSRLLTPGEAVDEPLSSVLDELSKVDPRRQTLIMHCDAGPPGASRTAEMYPRFVELLEQRFEHAPGGVHLYGLTHTSMAQLFEVGSFGETRESAETDDEGIEFDNRLAPEQPEIAIYFAVVGRPVSSGLSLIELPARENEQKEPTSLAQGTREVGAASSSASPTSIDGPDPADAALAPQATDSDVADEAASTESSPVMPNSTDAPPDTAAASESEPTGELDPDTLAALRHEAERLGRDLEYANERAELSERRRKELERSVSEARATEVEVKQTLEDARARISELEDELDDLRDPPDPQVDTHGEDAADDAPNGASGVELSARDQQLQWQLAEYRDKLHRLRIRPVEDAEAELASARAKLEALQLELDLLTRDGTPPSGGWSTPAPEPAAPSARGDLREVRESVASMARQLEAGGYAPRKLHDDLRRLLSKLASSELSATNS